MSGSGCFELRLGKSDVGRGLNQRCIPGSRDCFYELYRVGWTSVGLQGDMKTELLPVSEVHHIPNLRQICPCIYMYSFRRLWKEVLPRIPTLIAIHSSLLSILIDKQTSHSTGRTGTGMWQWDWRNFAHLLTVHQINCIPFLAWSQVPVRSDTLQSAGIREPGVLVAFRKGGSFPDRKQWTRLQRITYMAK